MRANELGMEPQGRSVDVSLGRESIEGYEQRLIQWECSKCGFFEKRVFRSGLPSEETGYVHYLPVCWRAG